MRSLSLSMSVKKTPIADCVSPCIFSINLIFLLLFVFFCSSQVYPSPEDNNDEDPFKLHDIVDVIGVLTLEPSMAPEEEAM